MKPKLLFAAALMIAHATSMAEVITVNVSGPGAINPFTGYRMTYYDKDRNSCTFRFNSPGGGLDYLVADKECPEFVTEKRVFLDAQKALEHMSTVSSALTFAEFNGDDGHGNKIKRAKLTYRCASAADITVANPIEWAGIKRDRMSGFVFMPVSDTHMDGWYELDITRYKTYKAKVGAWKIGNDMTITASYMGRLFTVPHEKIHKCKYHRSY